MTTPPLACTVRGCGRPLARSAAAWTCGAGHTFDISRKGYVNVLQPQDRRSSAAGDAIASVRARADLLAVGIGRPSIAALVSLVASLPLQEEAVMVELGAGGGDVLASIATNRRASAIGIDLSVDAVLHAATRHPHHTWVVANADRRLPLMDHSVELVVSYHGRRNPSECQRVLRPSGRLVVAVPAPNDLVELRERLGGRADLHDRAEALAREHGSHFELIDRRHIEEHHTLSRSQLQLLLRSTYRGARHSAATAVGHLDAMTVTLASDVCVFAPRPSAPTTES